MPPGLIFYGSSFRSRRSVRDTVMAAAAASRTVTAPPHPNTPCYAARRISGPLRR